MKNVKDIIKRATGKNLEIEESKTGYKIVDGTYRLTRGDADRIEAGLQARGICARCHPGRFRNIWIKPSDRVIDNENDNTTKQGETKMKYYNENENYGYGGPYEASSKTELADGMNDTFSMWAHEAYDKIDDDDAGALVKEEFIADQITEMRSEFINGLDEV